jgi:micrococcal nuclease
MGTIMAGCSAPAPPASSGTADAGPSCQVDRVSDGDTIRCAGGVRIRLTGIDTPELDQGALGRLSREALEALVPPGTRVRLEMDVRSSDQYGRTLAYVWRDSVMVNRAMLREGWALLYTVPPNVRYVESFRAAEDSARAARRGHWAGSGFNCKPDMHRRREC